MSNAARDPLDDVSPMVVDSRSLPYQLAGRIRQLIADGTFDTGSRLPTEEHFSNHFRVGRTTVREALKQLESEGAVIVRRGRGRFVSSVPVLHRPITRLESVTDMLSAQGYNLVNRVLSVDTRPATPDERTHLKLTKGTRVIALERLRLRGKDPYIYSIDVVPSGLLPDLTAIDWSGSLFDLLAVQDRKPTSAITTIRAAMLPPAVDDELGVDRSFPWLLMVQLNMAEDGMPVIYSHDYHRGDRFSFDVYRRAEHEA